MKLVDRVFVVDEFDLQFQDHPQPILKLLQDRGAPIDGRLWLCVNWRWSMTETYDPASDLTTFTFEHIA